MRRGKRALRSLIGESQRSASADPDGACVYDFAGADFKVLTLAESRDLVREAALR